MFKVILSMISFYLLLICCVGFIIGISQGNNCNTKGTPRYAYPAIPVQKLACWLGGTND